MKTILCLCHDVTEDDIAIAVRRGWDHPETVKRFTAAFMGPCQGRSCRELVMDAIARQSGVSCLPPPPASRAPLFPVRMGLLAGGDRVDC
jgi:bacterioferritin-associated ferredoxin